jgi:hypothetical protein
VIVNDNDFNRVLDPLLHLHDMDAVLADSLHHAQELTVRGHISAVILQAGALESVPASNFFKWLRGLADHQYTPVVLLTRETGLDEDEAIGAIAMGARIFRYPRELVSLLQHLEDATVQRSAA